MSSVFEKSDTVHDVTKRIAWDKAIQNGAVNDYSYAVSQNLWTLTLDFNDVELYYSQILGAITKAAYDTLPTISYRKHLKPYWTPELTELHRSILEFRQIWINENRPRGNHHQSYSDYKSSKNIFRDEMRKAFENHQLSVSKQIEESLETDQKLAWILINSRKQRKSNNVILKSNGKVIELKDVCNEFAKHFEKVAKIPCSAADDSDIVEKVSLIRQKCNNDMIRLVKPSELSKILIKLPNKKASGLDGISYEHLKYGGRLLEQHLCNFFNLIFDKCTVPKAWKTSIIIPLYKGGNKSRTEVDSYRGISLISSICKVFEKLIDTRLDEKLINFPNAQQMAYQKFLNSMFASFDLQETIHH